jgi:hypothetical protein
MITDQVQADPLQDLCWHQSHDGVPEAWRPQITVYDEKDGKRVATVFQNQAYADLITAAPDLLAAVEMVLDRTYEAVVGERVELEAKHVAVLRAASAKARGLA